MKIKYATMIATAVAVMSFVVMPMNAGEQDKKSNDTVDKIRQPDPPVASTGTVKTPTLQPSDHHKPKPKFTEPPPPPK
jgi:hypothetical protein